MGINCKKCHTHNTVVAEHGTSYLSALLIILVPKCPLCIIAYSSAITMCGTKDLSLNSHSWTFYIPIFLAALIITMILFNPRGRRTIVAAIIGLLGFVMILLTSEHLLSTQMYQVGTALLLIAVWTNSSFLSFLSALKSRIKQINLLWLR